MRKISTELGSNVALLCYRAYWKHYEFYKEIRLNPKYRSYSDGLTAFTCTIEAKVDGELFQVRVTSEIEPNTRNSGMWKIDVMYFDTCVSVTADEAKNIMEKISDGNIQPVEFGVPITDGYGSLQSSVGILE